MVDEEGGLHRGEWKGAEILVFGSDEPATVGVSSGEAHLPKAVFEAGGVEIEDEAMVPACEAKLGAKTGFMKWRDFIHGEDEEREPRTCWKLKCQFDF